MRGLWFGVSHTACYTLQNKVEHLITVIVMPAIEVVVQRFDEADISSSLLDQLRNVMHDIEGIGPFVAYEPSDQRWIVSANHP